MTKKVEIRFLEDFENVKKGQILKSSPSDAKATVEEGIAEYVEEPFKEIAEALVEDTKKGYVKVEGNNYVMDDGFQKQTIGKITKEEYEETEKELLQEPIEDVLRVFVDKTAYEELVKKYPAAKGTIDKFIERKAKSFILKTQEELERFGFEGGKKKEFIKEIGEFIEFIHMDYEESKVEKKEKSVEKVYNDYENQEEDEDYFFNITYSKRTGEETNRTVSIQKVANYLIKYNNFKTIYGEKTEKIKIYDGRIFSTGARGFIKAECEKLLGSYSKKNIVEEIFDKIKRKTKTTPEEFDKTDLYLIPLENGCYNIKTKRLQKHSPKNNFTFISPIIYEPGAKCERWFQFLEEALYPEDILTMKQWFGFNLFRQYFIKKAMICIGDKDVGKTILLDTLISFVGEKNKSGLSLQKISSGSDFSKFSLKNKLSNIYDDLSSSDINDGGAFKIATGGGYISAEEKFGDCVQFKTYAKQTLAGNKAPPVKDNDDDAYFSRFIPMKFDNVPEKIDPFLRDKLDKELSGILNWALEGLHEILEKGEFDFNKSDKQIKKIMELSGDNLIQFGAEVLEQSDEKVTKEEMYQVYCLWANENEKPVLSKEQLGRRLNQKVTYLIAKIDAKHRVWCNVKIKENWSSKNALDEKINNFKEKDNTLDTSTNNMRNYLDKGKKGVNNDNKNNKQEIGESVESVVKNNENDNTLDTSEKIEEQKERPKCSKKDCSEFGVLKDNDKIFCMEHSK